MRRGLLAAVCALLGLGLLSTPAHAAPAHPDRWVLHEAQRMGCVVEHREALPFGPRNQGVSCHVDTRRYDVLFYRRMGDAVDWWRHWIYGRHVWFARDGLVLIIPQGSTRGGVDIGLYRRDQADYAAGRLDGRVLSAR